MSAATPAPPPPQQLGFSFEMSLGFRAPEIRRTGPNSFRVVTDARPVAELSVAEAARILGVSVWTVYSALAAGDLTGRKTSKGRKARWRLNAARVWAYRRELEGGDGAR